MKVFNLTKNNTTYTSNAYYIRGTWNTLSDINTLIDTGRDEVFFDEIERIYTGVGKTRVERVLLTHSHYDHTGNLPRIIENWNPEVYAMSKSLSGVTNLIKGGNEIQIGDTKAIVIACPRHSSDSVCYYLPNEKVLFSGDTQVVNLPIVHYDESFLIFLEKIAHCNVQVIYPGHGEPITENCNAKIHESLKNIAKKRKESVKLVDDKLKNSKFSWINIESDDKWVGKVRYQEKGNCVKIYSITVYPEFQYHGFAENTINILKSKYYKIVADRVRPTAKGFWEKMKFNESKDGNFIWEKG